MCQVRVLKLSVLLFVPVLFACRGSEKAQNTAENRPDAISGTSLYNLTSEWLRQDSSVIQLADLGGRPQVMAMIYTSCRLACPRIISDMRHIEFLLGEGADRVGFVLVSIDPDHDTPAHLDTFAKESGFDTARWTMLHGRSEDVLELAAVLGVSFKKTTPMDFAHSNIITLLDPGGEITYQQVGLGTDPDVMIDRIRQLGQTLL